MSTVPIQENFDDDPQTDTPAGEAAENGATYVPPPSPVAAPVSVTRFDGTEERLHGVHSGVEESKEKI